MYLFVLKITEKLQASKSTNHFSDARRKTLYISIIVKCPALGQI